MFLKSDEIQALSFMLWQIYTQLGSRKLRAKFVTKKKLNIIVDEYDGETLSHNLVMLSDDVFFENNF